MTLSQKNGGYLTEVLEAFPLPCLYLEAKQNTTNCSTRVDGGLAGQSQVIGLSNEFTVDTCAHLLVCPLWSKRPIMEEQVFRFYELFRLSHEEVAQAGENLDQMGHKQVFS